MAEEQQHKQEIIYLKKKIAFLDGIIEGLIKNG